MGVLEYVEKIERKNWKKSFFAKILIFIAESLLYMLLAFFWGIKLFCSSKFEILMLFDLNNLSFYHCHSRASSIKNIPHLGLFLLSMAKWISKYIARDKFWTLWGYFGYFCSLEHLWDKLTHPCLITSFQTLPEIGLTCRVAIQSSIRILNTGFAHSKWPHLHRAYIIGGYFLFWLAVNGNIQFGVSLWK